MATMPPHVLSRLLPNLLATIDAEAFPAQAAAVHADSKWTLIGAASRTGKTYAGARIFVKNLMEDYVLMPWGEDREYWCVAPTFDDCRAQKIELLQLIPEWLIDWEKQGDKKEFFDESHGRGFLFLVGGARIMFKSAERPERLVAFKLRGIWWTEIARSKIAAWPNVYSRLSNYRDSWFIADTSPLGRCWFYKDVWEPAAQGRFRNASVHTWKAVDSPYVPREVIEEARANLPPEWFAREFEASWDAFQGQIYTVGEGTHLRETCPFKPEWAALVADLNTTSTHPAEFIWCYGTGWARTARAWVAGAYQKVIGLDYDQYAADIAACAKELAKQFGTNVDVVIDPSMHTEFKGKLRAHGLAPWHADNEILKGIRTLGAALVPVAGMPRMTFGRDAAPVIKQLQGMKWVVSGDGVVKPTPDKTFDDGWADCCRYFAMRKFTAYDGPEQVR